ncbi:MAG TPA: tyrosine-type recombinase/integrase, partial [Lacipirellulaceae bacterium]|nr:tyrosine-type recombinase/integrase [Lacipirellulaceae bacterium]
NRPLDSLTPRDARHFRTWLRESKPVLHRKTGQPVVDPATGRPKTKCLAENSARGILRMAKQFFNAAVEQRLLFESPFAGMKKTGDLASRDRDQYIDLDVIAKVLAACPDNRWRLIFALARFGGLRCPSEVLALRWGDVNWEMNRITVHSPKTEHHDGHAERLIPLFGELRPYLQAALDELLADEAFDPKRRRLSETPLISLPRGSSRANLRTQAQRIIKAAGVKPWPKPFVNLRATRATELRETFPDHAVNDWLGHTQKVAAKHYLQVRDEHFDLASGVNGAAPPPVHQSVKVPPIDRDDPLPPSKKPEKHACSSGPDDRSAPPVGLEPTTQRLTVGPENLPERPKSPENNGILCLIGDFASHCIQYHSFPGISGTRLDGPVRKPVPYRSGSTLTRQRPMA